MTELFTPGRKWQPVPDGAILPPGCQIELNQTTGARHARRDPDPDLIRRIEASGHLALLRERKAWVLWDYVMRKGRLTKPPKQPNGSSAKSNDPSTWATWDAVKAAYLAGRADGVGCMLSDGLFGTDLDDCVDVQGRIISERAAGIVAQLDSYTEVTPSGTGLRTFGLGALPPGARSCDKGDGEIAVYDEKRFLAVTGRAYLDRPVRAVDPALLAEIVREIEARQTGPRPARGDGGTAKGNGEVSPEVRAKLDTLLQNADALKLAWEKRGKPPRRNQSHSAWMMKVGGMLSRRGWSSEERRQALAAFNALHARPDKDGREVDRVVERAGETPASCPYSASAAGIIWAKPGKDGFTNVHLTNFAATIVGEVERDDGAERTLRFEIEATLEGRKHQFEISSAEFAGLSWATRELGAKAMVYPGFATKDHARAAIQMLSDSIVRRQVFGHLGWREIGGKMVYLHAGGAIGAGGLRIDVETDLRDMELFELPVPGDPKASLGVLGLGPLEVTAPVFASIWRAPIDASDFTLHLAGQTGVFKSELAALAQQHFGAGLDARHLAGWASTANSLEVRAFTAKDALVVVDDFAPSGSQNEIQRIHREAARLIRAQGNRAGRDRLRPDGTLRPSKPPRCLILSTGEDIPGGQSVRARIFVVEVGKGDIDQARLTSAQAASHRLSGAMAAYLQHLARDLAGIRRQFRNRSAELRAEAEAGHLRTSWIAGELGAALEVYLGFVDRMDLWPDCWCAIKGAAGAQSVHQLAEDPARRFVALVGALLASKEAHLSPADRPEETPPDHLAEEFGWLQVVPEREGRGADDDKPAIWRPQGKRIGWHDAGGETLFLQPEASYAAAQRLAASQGQAIGVGARTLWKRLKEAGLLAKCGDRNTYSQRIGGQPKWVVAISVDTLSLLYSPEPVTTETSETGGQNPRETAGSVTENRHRYSGGTEETVTKNGDRSGGNPGVLGGRHPSHRCHRFQEIKQGQVCDRPEHEGEPWVDDPAEQCNWRDESEESETTVTTCRHCGEPIGPDEEAVPVWNGQIHNRCADRWAGGSSL